MRTSEVLAGGALKRPKNRRAQIAMAAAELFCAHGYHGVGIDEIAATVGISGPAVYRHFPNKDAVLVELLVGISTRLHEGGSAAAEASDSPSAALDALVEFHLDFALGEPDLIRIQDRDLESLPADARRQVRQTQRKYVEVWVGVLEQLDPQLDQADARIKAHATFGLINSTPHSANPASPARARRVLRDMTLAALRTH